MQTLLATLHDIPLESRPDSPTEENKHLPNLRKVEELLSIMHAGLELRS